ncbi:hypothetical protein DOY81_003050 [Sarcophaga bullata]|nr:hypothetical protein DOY81_003050 [Sarcophaga bullata]
MFDKLTVLTNLLKYMYFTNCSLKGVGKKKIIVCTISFLPVLKLYPITNRRPLLRTTRRILRNILEPSYHSIGSNFLLASTSAITQDKLDKWRKEFYSEPKNILAQNVCSRFDPLDVCLSRKQLETTNHIFTYKVINNNKLIA